MPLNPYASPRSDLLEPKIQSIDGDGPWRMNNILVMRHNSSLPARCVKCNQPTSEIVQRTIQRPSTVATLLIMATAFSYIGYTALWTNRATRGWIMDQFSESWLMQVASNASWLFPLMVAAFSIFSASRTAKVKLDIPLSTGCMRAHRRAKLAHWTAVIIMIAAVYAFVAGSLTTRTLAIGSGVLLVTSVIAQCALARKSAILSPARITKEFLYLKHVTPEYLEALPEWPHLGYR